MRSSTRSFCLSVRSAAIALAFGAAIGCGAGAGLRAEYERLSTFPRADARGEHIAVSLPLATLSPLLEKKIADRPVEKSFGFPALGLGVKMGLRRIEILPARACASCLGLRVTLDAAVGTQPPGALAVAGEFPIEATLSDGRVQIQLHISRVRGLAVTLPAGWKEKVAAWVAALAPRGLLREAARAGIPKLIDKLSSGALALARTALVTFGVDLDRLTRFSFAVPAMKRGAELPIKLVGLRSTPTSLVAVVTTTLSNAQGPLPSPPDPQGTDTPRATVVVRGQTLFDGILYAMARDIVPSQFNAQGKPAARGDFRVTFEWLGLNGGRVRVHFWKLSSPAGVATLEGKLALSLNDAGALAVKTDGLRVVSKRGDFLFELGVWLKSELWGTTHDMLKTLAIPASIRVGGRDVAVRVRRVHTIDAGVVVEADLPSLAGFEVAK